MIRSIKSNITNWCLAVCLSAVLLIIAAAAGAGEIWTQYPEHYPREFTGKGRIARISDKVVVIDDRQYFLSRDIAYHTPGQEYALRDMFGPGVLVGYMTRNSKIIVSMYYLEQ
jgi:hypothetical protein